MLCRFVRVHMIQSPMCSVDTAGPKIAFSTLESGEHESVAEADCNMHKLYWENCFCGPQPLLLVRSKNGILWMIGALG